MGIRVEGAVVLTGGEAVRLDGADKAALELDGETLLERTLSVLAEVPEVVVVGAEVPTSRPVTFRREEPAGGGPAAGVLAGLAGFVRRPTWVAVLAVDMPHVTPETLRRLAAACDADGAQLVDATGRAQHLCGIYRTAALDAAAPEDAHGLAMHTLLEGMSLAQVEASGAEASDVDTWDDVRRLRGELDG